MHTVAVPRMGGWGRGRKSEERAPLYVPICLPVCLSVCPSVRPFRSFVRLSVGLGDSVVFVCVCVCVYVRVRTACAAAVLHMQT